MDLAELYAAGRWVALLDYIDGLPTACRLNEAIANDPEAAEYLASLPEPSGSWSPNMSEFGLTQRMMRDLIDEVKSLRQTLLGVNNQKPKQEKPYPVPVTEIDRAKKRQEKQWTGEFLGMFGYGPDDI